MAAWAHGATSCCRHGARWDWARERCGGLWVARGYEGRECISARQDVRKKLASKITLNWITHMPGCPESYAYRADRNVERTGCPFRDVRASVS